VLEDGVGFGLDLFFRVGVRQPRLRTFAMARQRGAIIRRGKIYYIKYRTPAGKQKWESGFPNRSQAQQRLNQLLGEITHGSYVEPKSTKFEKFAEEWLESRVELSHPVS
jgi:hypothetical protein